MLGDRTAIFLTCSKFDGARSARGVCLAHLGDSTAYVWGTHSVNEDPWAYVAYLPRIFFFSRNSIAGQWNRGITGPSAGNSPVTCEFPAQRPVMRSFDVFFDPECPVEQTIVRLVIWDDIELIMTSLWCNLYMCPNHRKSMYVMMMSSNGNIFRVTGPLWGESTDHRWILLAKASNAELWCFLWSAHEQTVEKTIETLVICDAIAVIMTSLEWYEAQDMLT